MMPNKNAYHTSLKIAVVTGHIFSIPDHVLEKIPSSTLSDWKNNSRVFIGSEYADLIQQDLYKSKTFHHPSLRLERAVFMTVAKIKLFVLSVFGKEKLQNILHQNMEKTVDFVERIRGKRTIKEVAEFIGISSNTFSSWRTKVKFQCTSSDLFLCAKRHPNQATQREVNTLRSFLNNPDYKHWGIANIWAMAFKNKETNLSLATWYKYNHALKIRLPRGKFVKKYVPLKASFVNEYWHCDISRITTGDTQKHYYYSIKDNFSKKELAWYLHHRVDTNITKLLIKKACIKAFGNCNNTPLTKLVSDGGPENTSYTIRDFIQDNQVNIQHFIALKDIMQSNSMIEAHFKQLKSGFLKHKDIPNRKELFKLLVFHHHEYNEIKPHSALGIYTPNEVYKGQNTETNFSMRFKQAAKDRRAYNRSRGCGKCQK